VNAARFLGTATNSGTIAPGKMADLVLLEADPLQNINNVFRQAGVILHGCWLPEAELQAELAGMGDSLRGRCAAPLQTGPTAAIPMSGRSKRCTR